MVCSRVGGRDKGSDRRSSLSVTSNDPCGRSKNKAQALRTSFAASFVTTISRHSGSGRVGCASSLSMPRCRSHKLRTLQNRVCPAKRLDHRTARIVADSARNCKWIASENKEPKNTKTWQKIVSNHIFWYFPGKVDVSRLSWRSRKKPIARSLAQLTNHWEKLSSALYSQILIKKSLLFQCVSQFPRRRRWFLVESIYFECAEVELRRRRRRMRGFEMCSNDRSGSFRWELFGEDFYLLILLNLVMNSRWFINENLKLIENENCNII